MNILIFVDMEGISGISGSDFVMADGCRHAEGRKLYTLDINACVEGCFAAGANKVLVRDGHGAGNYVLTELLDQRVELVQGHTRLRMPFLEEYDAAILLGYHAMAGTLDALLEHTYSSGSIQNLWLNGRKVGEIGIDAVTCGERGKPVIMVSGDDKACAEAADWIPGVVTCEVKQGLGCQAAKMLSLENAHKLIREKTIEAISKIGSIPLVTVETPATLRLEMMERRPIPNPNSRDNLKVIDARTYEVTAGSTEEAYYRLF